MCSCRGLGWTVQDTDTAAFRRISDRIASANISRVRISQKRRLVSVSRFLAAKLAVPTETALERLRASGTQLAITLAILLACLACSPARADVGVLLNESLDTSVARITGSGHSAVYFSRICPETPVKLRLCRAGEQGSVMSNYTTLGEDQPFEWNVVPLNVYLYGVENAHYRPLVGSQQIKHVLEERYRETYLSDYCAR